MSHSKLIFFPSPFTVIHKIASIVISTGTCGQKQVLHKKSLFQYDWENLLSKPLVVCPDYTQLNDSIGQYAAVSYSSSPLYVLNQAP